MCVAHYVSDKISEAFFIQEECSLNLFYMTKVYLQALGKAIKFLIVGDIALSILPASAAGCWDLVGLYFRPKV
jgi:hypothetical protein